MASIEQPIFVVGANALLRFSLDDSSASYVLHRCGLLMAARSMAVGAATGLVVTASHNPAQDNGVKLVEPSGYMLQQSWEVCTLCAKPHPPCRQHLAAVHSSLTKSMLLLQAHANRLAQCSDAGSLQSCLQDLFSAEAIAAGKVVCMHGCLPLLMSHLACAF